MTTITQVATFGDSWPAGAELSDNEKTFGEIIANNFNSSFYNGAVGASSADQLIIQLKQFIETEEYSNETLAIFFITAPSRSIIFKDNKFSELINYKKDDIKATTVYYKYIHTPELENFRINECMLALQRMCEQKNINDVYVLGWSKPILNYPGIDHSKIFMEGKKTCLNLFECRPNDPTDDEQFLYYDYNHFVRPNQCHPNQVGHQKIADELISWMSSIDIK